MPDDLTAEALAEWCEKLAADWQIVVRTELRERDGDSFAITQGALYAARYDAIAALLRAPAVPAGWRPIETAPKDGAYVLLCSDYLSYDDTGYYWIKMGSWRGEWSGDVDPTHWMPLPEPPDAG